MAGTNFDGPTRIGGPLTVATHFEISGGRNKARLMSGHGNPNGIRYAPTGSLFLRHDSGETFTNTSPFPGGKFWTKLDLGGLPAPCDAAPTQIDVGDAGSAGVAAEVSRCDHTHALPAPAAPPPIDVASDAGISTKVAREDHTHEGVHSVNGMGGDVIVAPGPALGPAPPDLPVGGASSAGVAVTASRSDHTHGLPAPGPASTVDSGDVADPGVSTKAAREDHVHGVPVPGNPEGVDVGSAPFIGNSLTFARSDHVHSVTAPGLPAPITNHGIAGSAGVSLSPARADHVHATSIAIAGSTISVGDAPATGVSPASSRGDHVHGLPAPGPASDASVGAAAAPGASTLVAREDHSHGFPAPAAPPQVKGASDAGVSVKVAREDHTHLGVASVNVLTFNGIVGFVLAASGLATLEISPQSHLSDKITQLAGTTLYYPASLGPALVGKAVEADAANLCPRPMSWYVIRVRCTVKNSGPATFIRYVLNGVAVAGSAVVIPAVGVFEAVLGVSPIMDTMISLEVTTDAGVGSDELYITTRSQTGGPLG